MKNFNNFQNFTTDYNINNNFNMGNNTIIPQYNTDSNSFSEKNNAQFYQAQTINPQMNYNINNINDINYDNNINLNNNINYDKHNDPNYPGDIKIKKQIAITDESCLHQ